MQDIRSKSQILEKIGRRYRGKFNERGVIFTKTSRNNELLRYYEYTVFSSVKKEKRSVGKRVILIKMISSFIARRRVLRKCIRVYEERLQSASEKRSHTSKFRQCAPCTDGRPARPVHFRSRRTTDRSSRGNINALRTRIFCL